MIQGAGKLVMWEFEIPSRISPIVFLVGLVAAHSFPARATSQASKAVCERPPRRQQIPLDKPHEGTHADTICAASESRPNAGHTAIATARIARLHTCFNRQPLI